VNKLPFTKPQAPEVWRTSLGERVHTTQNGHRLAVILATH
jgi:mRNA-degrading endonuclease toxin of MazEF toxin-antitoxin module